MSTSYITGVLRLLSAESKAWALAFTRLFGGAHNRNVNEINDLARLQEVVRTTAAFLAQGASYSYLRARSGTHAERLFREAAFGAALNRCKWEAFAAAAADLLLLVELEMRPHNLPAAELSVALSNLYEHILATEAVPEHRQPNGWAVEISEFRDRTEAALRHPPESLRKICRHTGRTIMRFAPVTDEVRELDSPMVLNNVEFRFIERLTAIRRQLDVDALVRCFAVRGAELHAADRSTE